MSKIPFLWTLVEDISQNNQFTEAWERVTKSANEETNKNAIIFK
jgi:hypothetical protein